MEIRITQRANDAYESVRSVPASFLEHLDGIVAIGGDGLFSEIMNGMLDREQRPKTTLRLGHIPAGSTDAVAWSVNGSRCPISAALRIVLGDRTPLDVMSLHSEENHFRKFSACLAGYGFMGDVISISEHLRWVGSFRYNLAGAACFFATKTQKAQISFIRAHSTQSNFSKCRTGCQWCQVRLKRFKKKRVIG